MSQQYHTHNPYMTHFRTNTLILETKSFNEKIKEGNLNPFDQTDQVVICSYQFAKSKAPYLSHTKWDLVVVDEAHRLRNVYKRSEEHTSELQSRENLVCRL